MADTTKNVAQSTFKETTVEDGFIILTYQNDTDQSEIVEREIDSTFIQFHFCVKGMYNQNLGWFHWFFLSKNSMVYFRKRPTILPF